MGERKCSRGCVNALVASDVDDHLEGRSSIDAWDGRPRIDMRLFSCREWKQHSHDLEAEQEDDCDRVVGSFHIATRHEEARRTKTGSRKKKGSELDGKKTLSARNPINQVVHP